MRYHNITTADMMNGEGLRVVLWLSGCSHHCYNCQNPVTWDENDGLIFDESAKEELFRELEKDYISGITFSGGDPLHEANLDGVLDLVTEINKRYNIPQDIVYDNNTNHNILNTNTNRFRLLFPNKSIWLYTGYKFEDCLIKPKMCEENIFRALRYEILKNIDVMVDGRYIDSQRNPSKKWAGSDNQRVIDIQESLKQGKVITLE